MDTSDRKILRCSTPLYLRPFSSRNDQKYIDNIIWRVLAWLFNQVDALHSHNNKYKASEETKGCLSNLEKLPSKISICNSVREVRC